MALLSRMEGINEVQAGVDEAGRGCWAGPVVAAAVILPNDLVLTGLKDSKLLTSKARSALREEIFKVAISIGIGVVSVDRIDQVNILNATMEAMHLALNVLSPIPGYVLVDGNRFNPWNGIQHQCIIKGDNKFQSIAAASIIAKTTRDKLMEDLYFEDPRFGWNQNKGYGTQIHIEALHKWGRSIHHRKTFRIPSQLKLF